MIRAMIFAAVVVVALSWAGRLGSAPDIRAFRTELAEERYKVRLLTMLVGRFARELRESDRSRHCLEGWEPGCDQNPIEGEDL